MKDNRAGERKQTDGLIEVLDLTRGQTVGHLANISSGGFMLVAREYEIQPNMVFQFRFFFPKPIMGRDSIDCGAESLWCDPAVDEKGYWAGFQIIDISDEEAELIRYLMDSL
ncbi:MAG: PilZ domain-containing protein [Gammaproteobacteria bacterium]|nr:PilZ domain-containing protein [Gammaproteobacteria bacterium]